MIKREMYMKRIRPFIGTELIKVMTGIRRCGKSVMLELIKEELVESGISSAQFISLKKDPVLHWNQSPVLPGRFPYFHFQAKQMHFCFGHYAQFQFSQSKNRLR